MIYTLTLNPSLDYVINGDNIAEGKVNRCKGETFYIGGKGINVSLMLKTLGAETMALGFYAGFSGEELLRQLDLNLIKHDFIKLEEGFTRINVKVRGKTGVTELNCSGAEIYPEFMNKLYEKLDRIEDGDILVLAGTAPLGVPKNIYEIIMQKLKHKNVRFAIDAPGKLLMHTLKYHPLVIKPNQYELGEIFGVEINDFDTAAKYAEQLCAKGAENVLVSMGSLGGILVNELDKKYYCNAPRGEVVNTVGAGDSALAGFLAEYVRSGDKVKALRLAVRSGSATAFSEWLAQKV